VGWYAAVPRVQRTRPPDTGRGGVREGFFTDAVPARGEGEPTPPPPPVAHPTASVRQFLHDRTMETKSVAGGGPLLTEPGCWEGGQQWPPTPPNTEGGENVSMGQMDRTNP
jgi:hypothetical protein